MKGLTMSLQARILILEKSLDVALKFLTPFQPGDSRAVDDWFVALASVQAKLDDTDGRIEACLDAALAMPDPEPRPMPEVTVTFESVTTQEQAHRIASRRMMQTLAPERPELEALLEKARNLPPMTDEEWQAQRASMARGLMED
jgi:hypothetical protein